MNKTQIDASTTDKAKLDKANLARCEATIKKGQDAFIATAKAVLLIINDNLFRLTPKYKYPKDYFADRWDISEMQMIRYRDAAVVLNRLELHGFTVLPINEGQCRALINIKGDERQLAVWDAVIKSGDKITAALITKLATPPEPPKTDDPDAAFAEVAESTGANMDVPKAPPKPTCTAIVEIEVNVTEGWGSSAVADAAEYMGVPVTRLAENVFQLIFTDKDRNALMTKFDGWDRLYDLKSMKITFGDPIKMV